MNALCFPHLIGMYLRWDLRSALGLPVTTVGRVLALTRDAGSTLKLLAVRVALVDVVGDVHTVQRTVRLLSAPVDGNESIVLNAELIDVGHDIARSGLVRITHSVHLLSQKIDER